MLFRPLPQPTQNFSHHQTSIVPQKRPTQNQVHQPNLSSLPPAPHLANLKVVYSPSTEEPAAVQTEASADAGSEGKDSSCWSSDNEVTKQITSFISSTHNSSGISSFTVLENLTDKPTKLTTTASKQLAECINASLREKQKRKLSSPMKTPPEIISIDLSDYVTSKLSIPQAIMKKTNFAMVFSVEVLDFNSPSRFTFQFHQSALELMMEEMG